MCTYDEAWIGICKKEGEPFCEKHSQERCWKCGEQAVRSCTIAGSLVCGVPSCKEHPHEHVHYK